MRKKLYQYILKIEALLANENIADLERVISEHLDWISFFSHERLVHLIVTALFAILQLLSFSLDGKGGMMISGLIFVLLVAYIIHYYALENGVQKLYEQYEKLTARR